MTYHKDPSGATVWIYDGDEEVALKLVADYYPLPYEDGMTAEQRIAVDALNELMMECFTSPGGWREEAIFAVDLTAKKLLGQKYADRCVIILDRVSSNPDTDWSNLHEYKGRA